MAADQGGQSLSDLPLDIVAHNAVFLLSGVLVAWLLSSILFRLGQLRPRSRLITSLWSFVVPSASWYTSSPWP
ncbi:hypothetical protein N7467_009045 [Penicillium canescens]|nr:hypothetical protein N7467_009045 [Penicillium canescens]